MRALAVPSAYHLKGTDGGAIGPVQLRSLEVLYAQRVIDERTPVSIDGGQQFVELRGQVEILKHVIAIRERMVHGEDPWETKTPVDEGHSAKLSEKSPLRVIFERAVAKATGTHTFTDEGGMEVRLRYLDGKIVEISTNTDDLQIGRFLASRGVVDAKKLAEAESRAPAMGGDLGAALIAGGAIPPHVYMEKLGEWARATVAELARFQTGQADFVAEEVKSPPVPLGLDRFKLFSEVAQALPIEVVADFVEAKANAPLILSGLEGASLDDLKLDPRSLRIVKSIDGTKTVGETIDPKARDISLRAIYLAVQCGFAVFGEDTRGPEEERQAKKLEELYATLRSKTYFELFEVDPAKAKDADIEAKYKKYAKQFHPDTLRPGSSAELVDVTQRLFGLYRDGYEAIKTEAARATLREGVKKGPDAAAVNPEIELKKAETFFKTKRFKDALASVELALKARPDDPSIKVHRAYYGYLARDPTEEGSVDDADVAAMSAVNELNAILQKHNELVPGWLFMARLQKALRKNDSAIRAYRKVLELDPGCHEAASEVRLANMRAGSKVEKKKK